MKNLHSQSDEMERAYYRLKSDSHALDFVNLLDSFRLKELYCDATIACDGKKYPVHQVVLSACSSFFASIFASVSCQNPLVVLQDISCWELESLLTYAYKGEVHVPHCNLQSFLKAGKSLFIKGLSNPHLEKPVESKSVHGSWHQPYYSHESRPAGFHGHQNGHMANQGNIPPLARIPHRDDSGINHRQHHSFHSPVLTNDTRIRNHFRRENMMEQSYNDLSRGHQKKHQSLPDYPQDLRVSAEMANERNSPGSSNSEYSSGEQARWEGEASFPANTESGKDCTSWERRRLKSEMGERLEDPIVTPPRFNLPESQGTFQELITGDEPPIKQEPEDQILDCDSKEGLKNTQDESDDDEEEAPLQIDMLEEPAPEARSSMTSEPKMDSNSYSQVPEPYSRKTESSGSSPTSQLKKELLRPIAQSTAGHLQQQQPLRTAPPHVIPISIPHPVIATREFQPRPQLPLREPPPLLTIPQNIPTLVEECESIRERPRSLVKEMPSSRGNSHLLVTAPPSYHSHNLSFEIHNQHLGAVLVNTGSHISLSPPSAFSQPKRHGNVKIPINNKEKNNNFGYDNEGPLNLSGFQRSPSKSPEGSGSEDPFLGKIVTNRKKRLRGPKSWEFLVRLLRDPTTNPNLIRWENESSGIFRLVQPAIIAQRWGKRTGKHANENLSYENFARGLRYHYATGALKAVSEKSFVYRFGPKALKSLQEDSNVVFSHI